MNSPGTFAILAWPFLSSGCALFQANQTNTDSAPPKRVMLRFCLADSEPQEGYRQVTDEQGRPLFVAPQVLLTERDVWRASVFQGPQRCLVCLELEPLAAAKLEQATAEHVGGRLAIFVDDELVMSPTLRAPLAQGKVFLDGGFSQARAEQIVRGWTVPAGGRASPAEQRRIARSRQP